MPLSGRADERVSVLDILILKQASKLRPRLLVQTPFSRKEESRKFALGIKRVMELLTEGLLVRI